MERSRSFIKDDKDYLIRSLINREYETGMPSRHETPFPKLANSEATLIAPHVDVRKAQTAFGRLAIPKLRKDVLHHDLTISRQALTSLLDVVHDPEKALEALNLNILARLVRLMVSEDDYIRHHTLCVIRVLAGQPSGPVAMAEKHYLIENLKKTLNDPHENVRLETANVLSLLGRSWFSYSCLVEKGFVIHILDRVYVENNRRVIIELLEALENIMDKSDIAKKQAIQIHACIKLTTILKHPDFKVKSAVIAVFTQLFIIPEGKKAVEACEFDLLEMLKKTFDEGDQDVLQNIISVGFLFITTPLKYHGIAIQVIDSLMPILLKSSDPIITKNTMQVLVNFAAAPRIKRHLQEMYLKEIQNIDTQCDPLLITFKERLLEVVTHQV